jgi:hypothetical protein
MRLAHFAFHPAVQNRLTQFPTITKFECGNFALRDVTVQGIRGDPQILRRLSHIHHFTRFIHEERHSGARTDANPTTAKGTLNALRIFRDAARASFMTFRTSERQGILYRSCLKTTPILR